MDAFCGMEYGRGDARKHVVGRAELGLIDAAEIHQVVERAVDRAQAGGRAYVRHQRQQVGTGRMLLGDPDLREDEIEVRANQVDTLSAFRRLRSARARRRGGGRIRHVDDGGGCCGEHDLRNALGILIDRLDAQRQAGEIRRDPEARTVGALEREIAGRAG